MKLDIVVNKYLLMWHLMYCSSVSVELKDLKQKIWNNYKKEYTSLYKEKISIIKELDDYIPFDDFLFNLIEATKLFKKLKQETNRYRLSLLEIWDKNRKKYIKELNLILRYDFNKTYKVCVLHPLLNVVETNLDYNIITIGKKLTLKDKDNFLTYMFYKLVESEFENIKSDQRPIIEAILELATTNELFTKVSDSSKYNLGKSSLKKLKHRIYPYWLMYLGIEEEKFEEYMIRDNIFFNIGNYRYNKKLKNMDIFKFIKYIVDNKKELLKIRQITIEEVEVI